MEHNGDAKTNGEAPRHNAKYPKDFDIDSVISRLPKVGYINSEGYTVLPSSYYHEEDDIYDE